jgi:hypothetical protein
MNDGFIIKFANFIYFRDRLGVFNNLVAEVRLYPEKHHQYLRMTRESFDYILNLIRVDITKQDTRLRKALPPDLKLALTLHHLATGEDYGNLHKHWRVGKSTCAEVVVDVCNALWNVMAPMYLQQPTTVTEWKTIADR